MAKLVGRFNAVGLAALAGRRSPGRAPTYSALQRERILAEARRAPVPAQDGTARWSLSRLQRALRQAPEGLPRVSTYTIWDVLRQAGYRFGRTRAWCPTGRARRKRKSGVLEVIDPDAEAKKLIEEAYVVGPQLGLAVWTEDEAGPYQTAPYAGESWQAGGQPLRLAHESCATAPPSCWCSLNPQAAKRASQGSVPRRTRCSIPG